MFSVIKLAPRARLRPLFLCILLLHLLGACNRPIPNDPEDTLGRLHGGTLRVGISDNPPWTQAGPEPAGVEVELVQKLAERLGTEVEWHVDTENDLFPGLEEFHLDLVIAGLTKDNPWSERVGFTRPYAKVGSATGLKEHVLAVPPGENAWLRYIEEFLLEQEQEIGRLVQAGSTEPEAQP